MVKIIDSVRDFYKDTKYLYLDLLGSRFSCPVKLSKQYNVKNMFIGNMWWSYLCSWKLLGFERSIIYD